MRKEACYRWNILYEVKRRLKTPWASNLFHEPFDGQKVELEPGVLKGGGKVCNFMERFRLWLTLEIIEIEVESERENVLSRKRPEILVIGRGSREIFRN